MPLIYGGISKDDIIKFYSKYLEESGMGQDYFKGMSRHLTDVDRFDHTPRFMVHDVIGHGLSFRFEDFVKSLRNLLKSIDSEISIFPGTKRVATYDDYEDLEEDLELLYRETGDYIMKVQNMIGMKQFKDLFGFYSTSSTGFDSINDAFAVLTSDSAKLRESIPTLKFRKKTFDLSNTTASELYKKYVNSLAKERVDMKQSSYFKNLEGSIVFQLIA